MSNGMSSIVLTLCNDKAFGESGKRLLDIIGASAMLYAAIALLVFEESFFVDDLIDNYNDKSADIFAWLEHLCDACTQEINNLKVFYEIAENVQHERTHPSAQGYSLIGVTYATDDEYIFIRASRNQSHHHVGNQWGVLDNCLKSVSGHRIDFG